ncbi:MAG: hypothetical protein K0S15_1520 [Solirubrobacterales bacterium]|nr:hypothetical protein [Solirubrobacterales bacterium]
MSGGPDRDRRGPALGPAYTIATRVFSVTIIGFGLAMVVVTLARGGGPVALGVIFGLLFVGIGAGRLWVSTRS